MHKFTPALFAIFSLSLNSFAASPSKDVKDSKEYCYFDGKAYSPGSRIVIESKIKQCKRNEKDVLSWSEPDK